MKKQKSYRLILTVFLVLLVGIVLGGHVHRPVFGIIGRGAALSFFSRRRQ